MKKLLLFGILCSFCICVKAQEFSGCFQTIGVSYHPMSLVISAADEKQSGTLDGIGLSWTNANALSSVVPLYIQYGVSGQYSFTNEQQKIDSWSSSTKIHFLSFKAPVELTYRLLIPGSRFYVAPYAGVDAVVYALGRITSSFHGDSNIESSTIDVFTQTSVYGDKFNRFNLDWHAGIKLFFNRFLIGASYEGPVIGLYRKNEVKINTSQVNLCIGFVF